MTGDEQIRLDEVDFIPEDLKNALRSRGISSLRKFQYEALLDGLTGRNLVITAPTGSGKTLVGEILAYLAVKKGGKALFLVPYKALAEEMYNNLRDRYPGIRIGISTGDYRELATAQLGAFYDLIVMTYEKADMTLRESPSWLSSVKLAVIDEVHMLGDVERGSLLDALITRLKLIGVQLIALSATVKNAEDIARWLNASLIESSYRPVKLLEGVYLPKRGRIYFFDPHPSEEEVVMVERDRRPLMTLADFLKESELSSLFGGARVKVDAVVEKVSVRYRRDIANDELVEALTCLLDERAKKGTVFAESVEKYRGRERGFLKAVLDLTHDLLSKALRLGTRWQILIFRRSRQLSQTTAERIADMLDRTGLAKLFPEGRSVAKQLLSSVDEPSPLTEALAEVIKRGVAFHHAGLTKEERRVVEEAFRARKIGVVVCTPTLGAGINLPARRVIVEHYRYDPIYGAGHITVAQYKQRGGRAGRPGLDSVGESVLVARNEGDVERLFKTFVLGEPEAVVSKLGGYLPELRRQVLAEVVFRRDKGTTVDEVVEFFYETFYAWSALNQNDSSALQQLEENVERVLKELESWGYVAKRGNRFKATSVGIRVSLLYLDPLSAKIMLDFLRAVKRGRISVEPASVFYYLSKTPDISHLKLRLVQNISALAKYIKARAPDFPALERLVKGYLEELIDFVSSGVIDRLMPEEEDELSSIAVTLLLMQWIELRHVKDILSPLSPSFGGGDFRELVNTSEWLLYCMRELATTLKLPIRHIKEIDVLRLRVRHGVPTKLLDLVRIPGVGRIRAMMLVRHGYDSLSKLAQASVSSLTSVPGIGETLARRIIEHARRLEGG